MQTTETTDWKFDFSTLPHWEDRYSMPYIYDKFLDIPQSNTLCCIYSIAEVTMCNYVGFLAIIKNKEKPSLFLNIKDFQFCGNMSANSKGNLIFLQPSIYDRKAHRMKRPILIIDIEKNRFAYRDTNNLNPCYTVAELKDGVFRIDADAYQTEQDTRLLALSREEIRTTRLKWRHLMELRALPQLMA